MAKSKMMRVVVLPACDAARIEEIDNTLEAVQAKVGGCFEVVPFCLAGVSIACNDSGRILMLRENRHIPGIYGDCFLFDARPGKDGKMRGLTEARAKELMEVL